MNLHCHGSYSSLCFVLCHESVKYFCNWDIYVDIDSDHRQVRNFWLNCWPIIIVAAWSIAAQAIVKHRSIAQGIQENQCWFSDWLYECIVNVEGNDMQTDQFMQENVRVWSLELPAVLGLCAKVFLIILQCSCSWELDLWFLQIVIGYNCCG